MPENPNPAERTAAESDYLRKFNRSNTKEARKLREQEATGDSEWKTATSSKKVDDTDDAGKKGRFGFTRGARMRRGSAFAFIIVLLGMGVWYTSVLAPNILLVNTKELYTNDLADATTALQIYTQIAYFNKIGPLSGQGCQDGQPMSKQPIQCKLTTMSRSQIQAFERQGFSFGAGDINVGGAKIDGNFTIKKVYDDKRDDGQISNDLEESRYKVYAIIPPNYSQVIESLKATGASTLLNSVNGTSNSDASKKVLDAVSQLMQPLKDSKTPADMLNAILEGAPITSGPQLWLYSQLSSTTKQQVYSVFNPRSSYFTDARYKERIKTRYNMTKDVTTVGKTESEVNSSFDNSVQAADGGLDPLTGQVNPTDGASLASLSSPLNLTQLKSLASNFTSGVSTDTVKNLANQLPVAGDLQVASNLLATNTYSYTELMCSWYTTGKLSSNALTRAKATTAARYALQYLKAADSIKAGTSQEVPVNVLASKLAENALGGYSGGSATDSLIYRSIAYGDMFPNSLSDLGGLISDPSKIVNLASDAAAIVAYNLSAYENIGTLAASWAQVIPNAAALGAVTGNGGSLLPPPLSATGSAKQYCEAGETEQNQTTIKGQDTNSTRCTEAIAAMTPAGLQPATAPAAELGRRTCPPVNASDDNLIQGLLGTWRGPVSNTILPSQKAVQLTMTPYITAWFGINTMLAAAGEQQLYTSQIKGIAANYALFSGMGELLGDMAESRGLMPSNIADMTAYLSLGEVLGVQNSQDQLDQYNAKQNQLDPYNKFSFVGSIVHNLSPTVSDHSPLFATFSNLFSFVGSGIGQLGKTSTASAFYHSQPSLLTGDSTAERISAYMLRLSGAFCPLDLEYFSIGITPDIMCNVRYSMPLEDIGTALNLQGVIDYMTGTHSDAYNSQTQELQERIGKAGVQGNKEYLSTELAVVNDVKNKPFIDKITGKPIPNSEYDKYLQYCVNRLDPWGRSGVGIRYDSLSNAERQKRTTNQDPDGNAINSDGDASPYEKTAAGLPAMAVTATQADQDWYSGKKCTRMTDDPQMLQYFRVYTMLCSVDGSMAGIEDCTQPDHENQYSDPFYLNNDILYTSWY